MSEKLSPTAQAAARPASVAASPSGTADRPNTPVARNIQQQPRGASVRSDGVLFRLWAPNATRVDLVLESDGRSLPMVSAENGWFEQYVQALQAGALYGYRLDGGDVMPDPASRFQPRGVHGPSQVIDPSRYQWLDADWRGVAQKGLVFYQLHVGTFTPQGTFRGVRQQLAYLKRLGVTAIQLMPVSDFPGRWNWGYDPASLFAPSRAYGTPDDLRWLVDAAHQHGMAAFLDVVYNHLGPDGAYAAAYAPLLSPKHATAWGPGINLDDEHHQGVRRFLIDNALHWFDEYHVDGLRLDATHALLDDSETHFLAELSSAVDALPGRKRYLVAEDERNLRTLIVPRTERGYGLDAVWADDFHHQVRNITAGDTQAYYADFAGSTTADLATTLRQGWFYTGQFAPYHGRPRGTDPQGLAPERFVICIQNHDQVGNRCTGGRLHHEIPLPLYRAASALLLFAPQLPLLFMGQEWAARSPFQYFTDHGPHYGPLVSQGRRTEFQYFAEFQGCIPDPQDPQTIHRSRLAWNETEQPPHSLMLALYRDLLELRSMLTGPAEPQPHGPRGLQVRRGEFVLLVALADDQLLPIPPDHTLVLHTEQPEYAEHGKTPEQLGQQFHFVVSSAAILRAGSEVPE